MISTVEELPSTPVINVEEGVPVTRIDVGKVDERSAGRSSTVAMPCHRRTCVDSRVPRRPLVLVAVEPPLLADLLRVSLPASVDVVLQPLRCARRRTCDVAVVGTSHAGRLRARHIVRVRSLDDFGSLVRVVGELCGVRPTD